MRPPCIPVNEEVQWAAAPTGLQVSFMNACNVKINALYLSAIAFSKPHDYLGWFGVSSGRMRVMLLVVGAYNSPAPGERFAQEKLSLNFVTV